MRAWPWLTTAILGGLIACSDNRTETPDFGITATDVAGVVDGGGAGEGRTVADGPAPTDPDRGVADAPQAISFVALEVDPAPDKPAFVAAEDLDGDGTRELIVSVFAGSSPIGNGMLTIYTMTGAISTWTKQVVVDKSAGIKFPNAVTVADIDGDTDKDLVLPYGFLACVPLACGGLGWLEDTGAGWTWHDVVANGSARFYHRAELADINGDGATDIVTVGETKGVFDAGSAETQIFWGDVSSIDRFETTPVTVGPGLGSLPSVIDLDNDGDLDIVSAQYFGTVTDSVAWYERDGAGWTKHVVVQGLGPAIQLSFVPDLLGTGQAIPVLSNHTNTADDPSAPESAIFVLQLPADPSGAWSATTISSGIQSRASPILAPQAAPGVFDWGDLDGDGDIDLLVSGDGDPTIYWLQQQVDGSFATRILAQNLPQSGVAAADLDGDGAVEAVVSSYEADRLVIFRRQ